MFFHVLVYEITFEKPMSKHVPEAKKTSTSLLWLLKNSEFSKLVCVVYYLTVWSTFKVKHHLRLAAAASKKATSEHSVIFLYNHLTQTLFYLQILYFVKSGRKPDAAQRATCADTAERRLSWPSDTCEQPAYLRYMCVCVCVCKVSKDEEFPHTEAKNIVYYVAKSIWTARGES